MIRTNQRPRNNSKVRSRPGLRLSMKSSSDIRASVGRRRKLEEMNMRRRRRSIVGVELQDG